MGLPKRVGTDGDFVSSYIFESKYSHITQQMEPVEQKYVAPRRDLFIPDEPEEPSNNIQIRSSRRMSTKEEAEERRKAEENRRWIMQMTAQPKKIEAPAHRAGLNPNFPAHAHSKSQVQPKVQPKSKIISSSSDSESDEEILKITTKIESPKIKPKISPKDLLLQKLQQEKIVDKNLSPVENEKPVEIEITNDVEPEKPKPKKKSKKQKLEEELEDIPKENIIKIF